MTNEEPSSVKGVKSAERVLDIIEVLSMESDGLTFSRLQKALDIPKSSLHHLLDSLTVRSYLEYDADTRRFSLGIRIWEAGQAARIQHTLIRVALPIMNRIGTTINETVQLATLNGTENVYLAKVDSSHPLRVQSEVGRRLLSHATAVGKELLAHLTETEIRNRYADTPLERMTSNTITELEALIQELRRIRERGFSIDNQEYIPGLFCVAVPVFNHQDRVIAALSISVPIIRTSLDLLATGLVLLAKSSQEITRQMGGSAHNNQLQQLEEKQTAYQRIANLNELMRFLAAEKDPQNE